ncbi:MAG: GGDEF domain-containing protein [bacterium]|nr:GGDEF domain-containing protein [bacterium]
MQNITNGLSLFDRLIIGLLRIINPPAADLLHYKKQCEIYEKTVIPQMSQEAREMISRLSAEKRIAESAFYELNGRYSKVRDDLFIVQGKYQALKSQQHFDTLTKLLDREGISNAFHRVASSMQRTATRMHGQEPDMSILFIDVDKFKEINDVNGHPIGDQVLKIIAKTMKESFRKDDIPGRFGGEEFIVVLPNATILEAKAVAEKFRIEVEHHPLIKVLNIRATVSIGVAKVDLNHSNLNEAMDDVIVRADAAMYVAKDSGRNKVCVDGECQ